MPRHRPSSSRSSHRHGRRRRLRNSPIPWLAAWALGLAGLVGLNAFAVTPRIEQRLLADVRSAVAPIVTSPVMVSVSGHEATITGPVSGEAEREALLTAMADIDGVRDVVDRLEAPDAPAGPLAPTEAPSQALADAPDLPPDPTAEPLPAPDAPTDELALAPPAAPDDASPEPEPEPAPGPSPDALADAAPEPPPDDAADSPSLSLALVDRALTLEGRMNAADDITRLIQPALDAFDPSYLTNRVDTSDDVAGADWLTPLAALLPELDALADVAIDIDERQVTLAGSAPSRVEHDRVIEVALEAFDDYALVERIDVVARPNAAGRDAPSTTPLAAPAAASETVGTDAAALRAAIDALESERILFESSRAQLTDGSAARLDELARLFARFDDLPIEIEGHTDASGPADTNLSLSQARASAVRQALIDRGVAADRLTAYGYGEGVPLVDNTTPEGRARNRRIEFRF